MNESSLTGNLVVRPLRADEAPALHTLLRSQTPEYAHFFRPFDFNQASICHMLLNREQDVFMGMFWQGRLVGFFMLRGWDEGYEVPAYGALIDEAHSGYGLATLSLRIAKAISKLSRAPRIMLKVHQANTRAKSLFERAGFIQTGVDPDRGIFIFHFDFDEPSKRV